MSTYFPSLDIRFPFFTQLLVGPFNVEYSFYQTEKSELPHSQFHPYFCSRYLPTRSFCETLIVVVYPSRMNGTHRIHYIEEKSLLNTTKWKIEQMLFSTGNLVVIRRTSDEEGTRRGRDEKPE